MFSGSCSAFQLSELVIGKFPLSCRWCVCCLVLQLLISYLLQVVPLVTWKLFSTGMYRMY